MAIMSKGPGKRTKAAPKKATVKSTVSMIKNMFSTGGKNLGKAKGPGAAAGVASRAGGVNTLTSAKVTGSKQKGIEGLKAKKKSGEMSRAEANAKIKALKGKTQPVKKEVYLGQTQAWLGSKGTGADWRKTTPVTDSSTFISNLNKKDPTGKLTKLYTTSMKNWQKQDPTSRFKDFQLNPKTGEAYYKVTGKKATERALKGPKK